MSVDRLLCYGEPTTVALSLTERAVLQVLRDARGYFRSSGLTAEDIGRRLVVRLSARVITDAANALVNLGFAELTRLDRYRLAQPRNQSRDHISNRLQSAA